MPFRIGDLVIKRFVSGSKPVLVTEISKDYEGWWVRTEREPDTWIMESAFELVSEISKKKN